MCEGDVCSMRWDMSMVEAMISHELQNVDNKYVDVTLSRAEAELLVAMLREKQEHNNLMTMWEQH